MAPPTFPLLINNESLVYLDNAATTQKPQSVIDAISEYYSQSNANPGRGIYDLSQSAFEQYESARSVVAEFIGAQQSEIIFTKGTTEAINILCHRILPLLPEGRNEIVLSEMEHHANLIPWQEFAKAHNFTLRFIPVTDNYELDYGVAKQLISEKTALVSVAHVSNVLGTQNDVTQICSLAQEHGALSIVDAAQSIAHISVNVSEIGCDFLAFSGHKMYGPMGIGVLYGKQEHLAAMRPLLFGGGMVERVTFREATFREAPYTFEAGTVYVPGAVGLASAIHFLQSSKKDTALVQYAYEQLSNIEGIHVYAAQPHLNIGIFSFTIDGVHPHDVASLLNEKGIAIRAGDHCAMPLHQKLNLPASCRMSLGVYNTKEDVDALVAGIITVKEKFK